MLRAQSKPTQPPTRTALNPKQNTTTQRRGSKRAKGARSPRRGPTAGAALSARKRPAAAAAVALRKPPYKNETARSFLQAARCYRSSVSSLLLLL